MYYSLLMSFLTCDKMARLFGQLFIFWSNVIMVRNKSIFNSAFSVIMLIKIKLLQDKYYVLARSFLIVYSTMKSTVANYHNHVSR